MTMKQETDTDKQRQYHQSMTLQEAEFIANEFNKLTSVQSAEVVPNVDGDYSVLITRTDGRRAVSCDLDTADGALRVVKIEEDYAHAVYATLGEGNVPVFCSRGAWKARRNFPHSHLIGRIGEQQLF